MTSYSKARAETDAFRVVVVQDFDGVAVEDPDNLTLILRSRRKQERMSGEPEESHRGHCMTLHFPS